MLEYCIYALILLAYSPGLIYISKVRSVMNYPLVVFCFVGMFLLNAAGSIFVLTTETTETGIHLFSYEYILMLLLQVFILYLVFGLYLYTRAKPKTKKISLKSADRAIIPVLVLAIGYILLKYYSETEVFLIYFVFTGSINASNVLRFRQQFSYGLDDFSFYRLGFITIPSLLATHILLLGVANKKFKKLDILLIISCLIPSLLLGEKSGILMVAAVMAIGYVIYAYSTGISFGKVVKNPKFIAAMTAAFVPTVITYSIYYKHKEDSIFTTVYKIIYRISGVYTDSLAATVPLVKQQGFLWGVTLPNIRGLLGHQPESLDRIMHFYFHDGPGAKPVPSLGEGYVNFGWIGFVGFAFLTFISVIIIQELCLRTRTGLFSYSLIAYFSYLSLMTSATSVFATMISLTFTALFLGMVILWHALSLFPKIRVSRKYAKK